VVLLGGGGDAAFSVQEWRAGPGAGGIPVHVHHETEEAFYVVDGEIGLWLGEQSVVRGRGSCVVVAPGRSHTFWNPRDRSATYLTVISPAGLERYLVDLAHGLRQAATDEEAAALRQRIGTGYDITVVGPPPPRTG
jgi:mannose-6-phosphate isomerase-like protein (cupin superfamily)